MKLTEYCQITLLLFGLGSLPTFAEPQHSKATNSSTDEDNTTESNCQPCEQYVTNHFNYAMGLAWLNAEQAYNHPELDYSPGFNIQGRLDLRYWQDKETLTQLSWDYWDQDAQQIKFVHQKPGTFRLLTEGIWSGNHYDNKPSTYFQNISGWQISLPSNWVLLESTEGLAANLVTPQTIDSKIQRRRLLLQLDYQQPSDWQSGMNLSSQQVKSLRMTMASLLTSATSIPLISDYTTDSLSTYLTYQQTEWQLRGEYSIALFQNRFTATEWQNPFIGPAGYPLHLQYSQPPDNKFHQFSLLYAHRFDHRRSLSVTAAQGEGKQHDTHLLFNDGSVFDSGASAGAQFAGQVKTRNIRSHFTQGFAWPMKLHYHFNLDERENQSTSMYYSTLADMDTITRWEQFTLLNRGSFDYRRAQHKLRYSWRIKPWLKLQTRHELENYKRQQKQIESDEKKHKFNIQVTPLSTFNASLQLGYVSRDGNFNDILVTLDPTLEQHSLLSRFHASQFDRRWQQLRLQFNPSLDSTLSWETRWQNDHYPNANQGVESAQHKTQHLDFTKMVSDNNSFGFFLSHEQSKATQLGGETSLNSAWQSHLHDHIVSLGAHWSFQPKDDRWQHRVTVLNSQFKGEQQTHTILNEAPFPLLKRQFFRLDLNSDFQINTRLKLKLMYRYERQNNRNWQDDLMTVDNVSRLLPATLLAPDYKIHLVILQAEFSLE